MSRCLKNRSDGEPCQAQAVAGTDACRVHAGRPLAEQKARGDVVVALRRWGVADIPEEPGMLLLKLMTVTSWRQQEYEDEIQRVLTDTGLDRAEALVGDTMVVDKDGSPHKVGEYIRGIVVLERQERELAANLAIKALAANVQERITRVQEQTGALVAEVIRASFGAMLTQLADMGLPSELQAAWPQLMAQIVPTQLRALGPAA